MPNKGNRLFFNNFAGLFFHLAREPISKPGGAFKMTDFSPQFTVTVTAVPVFFLPENRRFQKDT
jgi:hypothetical protein